MLSLQPGVAHQAGCNGQPCRVLWYHVKRKQRKSSEKGQQRRHRSVVPTVVSPKLICYQLSFQKAEEQKSRNLLVVLYYEL